MENDTAPSAPVRFQSLDILRGLVMFVMLFVNELAGVRNVPPWMEHIQPSTADGMTFVDLVFPAFLFIVGVSIPFAVGNRLARGVPTSQVWLHILTRTSGLLIMGFFMVNSETIAKDGPLPPALWSLLIYIGIALTWMAVPQKWGGARTATIIRMVGMTLLVIAALVYHGNDATGFFQMRPQWWGILGLIGWAYLGACIVYMFCRPSVASVVGAIALIYCVAIADSVDGLRGLSGPSWLAEWISIGKLFGSQTAITVAGVALGMMLTRDSPLKTHSERIRWAFLFGLALLMAGILLHTANGLSGIFHYNKNAATIPWCLVSSGVTAWLWIIAYVVGDMRPLRGATALTTALMLLGQNALLAYILAPLISSVMDTFTLIGVPPFYNMLGRSFATGFWRSVAFAVFVSWIAGIMQRRGVHLRV